LNFDLWPWPSKWPRYDQVELSFYSKVII